MSRLTWVDITCDDECCDNKLLVRGDDTGGSPRVNSLVKKNKWKRIDSRDYCPQHKHEALELNKLLQREQHILEEQTKAIKVIEKRKKTTTYRYIDGTNVGITKHALKRQIERTINSSDIEEALVRICSINTSYHTFYKGQLIGITKQNKLLTIAYIIENKTFVIVTVYWHNLNYWENKAAERRNVRAASLEKEKSEVFYASIAGYFEGIY